MRRIVVSLLVVGIMALSASAVSATSGAHFFSATGSVADSGALVVTFDEAGVGQQQVNYVLTADSTATYACLNGGGNHPKAANKATFAGPVSSPTTGFTPNNGRVTGSLSAGPISAGGFSCPSGQTLVLARVSYTNIVLTDITNNVSANVASISRTFFNV
ncbi:MAG TPA: hypothetical protein VF763_14000 [Candidatus Limnocylindrales bacterium]